MKTIATLIAIAVTVGLPPSAFGLDVKLADGLDYIDVQQGNKTYRIQRVQDVRNTITGPFARTSRKCPPFCIHPMEAAPGVKTIGEIELFDFIQQRVSQGSGLVVDCRTEKWYRSGTIPGALNVPFTAYDLGSDAPELIDAMAQFGVKRNTSGVSFINRLLGDAKTEDWDFSEAKELAMFCNGLWCDQSPRAIRKLVALGYPPEKLHYYRGGMQSWNLLGLNTVKPKDSDVSQARATTP